MIDVIIPAYNANETILKTLFSICIQTIKDDIKVYIIDNGLKKSYDDIKEMFNDKLDITIECIEKKVELEKIIKKGIEISNNPYIFFINPGDKVFHGFSLEVMLNYMEDNDIVIASDIAEFSEQIVDSYDYTQNKIMGRLYKREFLQNNEYIFNDLNDRLSEFHKSAESITDKIEFVDEYIYFA